MRDQSAEMNHIVFVNGNLIKIGNARYVNERVNSLANAALQFEDKIRAAGDDSRAFFFIR